MKNVQTTLTTLNQDLKAAGITPVIQPTVVADQFTNHVLESDLPDNFWNDSAVVSDSFKELLNTARQMAKETANKATGEDTQRGLSLIVGKQMLDNLTEEADSWLHRIVLMALLKQHRHWLFGNKVNGTKVLNGTIIRKHFREVAGEGSFMDDKLEEVLDFLKGYEAVNGEGYKVVAYTELATGQVLNVVESDVNVYISSTGLRVGVSKGKTIMPTRGQAFKFKHGTQVTLGADVVNGKLKHVLQMIRIHNVREEYIDKAISNEKAQVYTKASYKFNPEDALVLAVLLKVNNISLKDLFAHKAADANKLLVLARIEDEVNPRSLFPVVCPAHTFPEAYGLCGVVSSTDAASGFYTKMITVPRLIEFNNETGLVYTISNVGKVVARFDKLNNSKAIWARKIKLFVCASGKVFEELSQGTAGGNILTPNSIIESDGACRVVSPMDQGGVKASYTPFKGVDNKLAKGDTCVIGANGFKGGILAAVGLLLKDTDFLKSLHPMVAAEAVIRALNPTKALPKNLLELEEPSSKFVNRITDTLVRNLSEMVINGVVVRGVLVEVEVKITNTYTLDRLQFADEAEDDLDEGTKALEEAQDSIKKLQNQLMYGTVSTNGLRAFVADKKANGADDFSVSHWVDEGLKDGTLKRKALRTRVIMQELQSIESWYGKDVAMAFFNELLEAQQSQGFDINKLYATQHIGFFDKEILGTVKALDLAIIVAESKKGAVHNNTIYFKEVINEVLALFPEHDGLGWVTVEYPNGSVDVPMGNIFIGDTVEQMTNDKSYVVAKGLLADLLENVKSLINEDGTLRPDANNNLLMGAMVQKPLLGKNFGYQFAKGFYGVALPLVGHYGPTVVGVTNRDRLVKSDNRFVPMAMSKAPQYFKGMTSAYNVLEMQFGYYMDLMLEAAVFMYTETFLAFLNDFDGDLARITVQGGTTLPFAELNYKEFNGNFFKMGHDEEVDGNMLKISKARACTVSDYHKAVFESVTAKNNVGMYTANSYFYEAMTPNMVGETILSVHDEEVIVTRDLAYRLNAILKMLIQVEAMDNVKQEGSKTFLSELFFNWSIRSIMEYRTEEQQRVHFMNLYTGLMSLVKAYDMDTTAEEISAIVGLAKATAIRFPKEETTAFNMFNARNINDKNRENIMKFIRCEDDGLNTIFNFEDSADRIVNGSDQNSMYQQVILGTAKALEDCNFKIYVGDQG